MSYESFFTKNYRIFNYNPTEMIESLDVEGHMQWVWPAMETAMIQENPLVEPIETLDELYRIRAQQLRDKYSYIKLMYSGGPDSHNMLEAFMLNNIFVDEICIFDYNEFTNRSQNEKIIRESTTERQEIDVVAIPLAQHMIRTYSPKTKLTFDYMVPKLNAHVDTVSLNTDKLVKRSFRDIVFHGTYLVSQKAPKGGIVLYGNEKPLVKRSAAGVYTTFWSRTVRRINEDNVELFYTHPTTARMIIKQCHEIMKAGEDKLPDASTKVVTNRKYEDEIAKIIYNRKHTIVYTDTWKDADMANTPLAKRFMDTFNLGVEDVNYNMMYYIMNNDKARDIFKSTVSMLDDFASHRDEIRRAFFGSYLTRKFYLKMYGRI